MNALNNLCAELDLAVLKDVVGDAASQAPQHVYAVGCEPDGGAGIPGFVITPWFTSTCSLADYCEAQYEQIIEKGAPEC